ncbi:tetratricopeptide repeat protein [Azospirillum doebereinerae]
MTAFRQELRTALASDRMEDAVAAYRRLHGVPAAEAAGDAEDMELIGHLAGRAGEAQDAAAWLERAAAAAPTRARWAALGEARTAACDHVGAEQAWRRAVETQTAAEDRSSDAAVWLGLGDALRELARWEAAAQAFRQAAGHQPRLAPAWAGLAVALVNLGDAGQGFAAARAALEIDPALPAAHRAIALACLKAQRLDDAERACRAALEHAPRYPEGLATLALLRMMQGRLTEADALFGEATGAKPGFAEAIGNHAAVLARLGRRDEARREAARAVRLKPFLPAAAHLLGTLLRDDGQFEEAAATFAHVLTLSPGHTDARLQLADTLRTAGRAAEAAEICRAGLERQPDHAGLLINLGAALQTLGDSGGALAAYHRALDHHPGLPEAHNNLARLYQDAGRLDKAVDHLRHAAAARPQDAGIARNLAAALLDCGQREASEAAAREAVRLAPADPANHGQLAHALAQGGRLDEAAAAIDAALANTPPGAAAAAAEACVQAAALFIKADDRVRAIPYCREAIRLQPENGRNWAIFGQALRWLRLTAPDPELRADLLRALTQSGVEHSHLMDAAVSAVLLEPAMAALHAATQQGDGDEAAAALPDPAGAARGLSGDALLVALLNTVIVTEPALERTLTVLRRALLALTADEGGASPLDRPDCLPVLCALARQCFLNEYAFAESPEETAAAEALGRSLLEDLARPGGMPAPARVALFAAYRPLSGWAGGALLPDRPEPWPEEMRGLLEIQVEEPRAEAALAAAMPSLTPMDGSPVSRLVRAQYESNPYPRWADAGLLDAPMTATRLLRALFPHTVLDAGPDWNAPAVLIAGCGTGRESVWAANQIAGARILAVDLSLASLAYAQRQTRKLQIGSIDYAQADLMELGGLERRFDIIQSVGVLHHLADPLAGWRVLTGLLRPGGLMRIGLYSEKARGAVVAAREHIARNGYGSTTAEIRRFRQDVLALPAGHPVRAIADSPDFHNVSACRDLVFHVQEHRVTLPQLAGWIAGLGLDFIGFQLDDPALAQRYRRRFPEDPDMGDLSLWDRFEDENPQIFGGLYQFWVRRRP